MYTAHDVSPIPDMVGRTLGVPDCSEIAGYFWISRFPRPTLPGAVKKAVWCTYFWVAVTSFRGHALGCLQRWTSGHTSRGRPLCGNLWTSPQPQALLSVSPELEAQQTRRTSQFAGLWVVGRQGGVRSLGDTTMPTVKSRKKQPTAPAAPKASARRKKSATPAHPSAQTSPGPTRITKRDAVLKLLSRPDGSTIDEIMAATDWQAHSVRGFLSGTVKKQLGIDVTSERVEGEPRRYRIAAEFGA